MKRQARRFAYLLLSFVFLVTTMLGFSGAASGVSVLPIEYQLSSLTSGNTVTFAGYQWIVLNPSTGYLLMASGYNSNYNYTYNGDGSADFIGSSVESLLDGSSGGTGGFYGSLPSVDRSLIQYHTWSLTNENGSSEFNPSTVQDYIGMLSYSDGNTYSSIINSYGIFWTLTPYSGKTGYVWSIGGGYPPYYVPAYDHYTVVPALYLNPDIWVAGGNGGTVIPFDPTESSVAANPSATMPTGNCTVTVTLKNSGGNPVSGVAVQLAPSSATSVITPSGGSAGSAGSAVSATTNSSGVATFTVTDSAENAVTYTATDTTDNNVVIGATVVHFSSVVDATQSTIATSTNSVPANGSATATITVTLKTAYGNPVVGELVTLYTGSGHSTIYSPSAGTNSSGVIKFIVYDTKAETVVYTAIDPEQNVTLAQTATVTFTGSNDDLSSLTVSPGSISGGFSPDTAAYTVSNSGTSSYPRCNPGR